MVSTLVLIYFGRPWIGHTVKINFITFQAFDLEIRSIFILNKVCLGLVSPPYFLCNFSRNIFLMLYSINWPNFTAWLSLFLEILGNMFVVIIRCLVCDIINFEIYYSFLIKPFNKKVTTKMQISQDKKSF